MKELFLDFLDTLDEFHFARTHCRLISYEDTRELATVTFRYRNLYIKQVIRDTFDDELVGYIPDTNTKIKIQGWEQVLRNAHEFE